MVLVLIITLTMGLWNIYLDITIKGAQARFDHIVRMSPRYGIGFSFIAAILLCSFTISANLLAPAEGSPSRLTSLD